MPGLYRPNVAVLMVNDDGKLLLCERRDFRNSWQFPQGGVDRGETLVQALHREMDEELGLEPVHYRIITQKGGYRYQFPTNLRRFRKYVGQEQTYFLAKLLVGEETIRLDKHKPEFRAWKWIDPYEFDFNLLPDFKRTVYRKVMRDFFGVGDDSPDPEAPKDADAERP